MLCKPEEVNHVASSRQRDLQTKPTIEGAGVKLQRAFGFGKTKEFDPFLLLDDFRNENPADYLAGFPWHPHRGIETITYVLAGEVAHGDSLGNKGRMTAGDVQWMTAGSGILHQEMPKGDEHGRMHGFQLWANLPAALKMTDPRYQDIPASAIPRSPRTTEPRRASSAASSGARTGPVEGVARNRPALRRHLGAALQAQADQGRDHAQRLRLCLRRRGNLPRRLRPQAVLTESGVDPNAPPVYDAKNHSLVLFDRGDEIVVQAGPEGIRFLLVSGKPLEEPVAWYGPIVMNTQAELRQAMSELLRLHRQLRREEYSWASAPLAQRAQAERVVALGQPAAVVVHHQPAVEPCRDCRNPSARLSRICRAVDLSRSAPRTTSVMPMAASSATQAS
jgi:quercetin 2,3-dioxygenase